MLARSGLVLLTVLCEALASSLGDARLPLPQYPLIPEVDAGLYPSIPDGSLLDFRLAHIFHHGTIRYPGLHRRLDIAQDTPIYLQEEDGDHCSTDQLMPPLLAQAKSLNVQRLVDRSADNIGSLLEEAWNSGAPADLPVSDWTVDEIPGPNISDKRTILTMARCAANAYVQEPNTGNWEDVKGGFNYTEDFGWESDGLRGHIFADPKNSTVIIGLKGTSVAFFEGGTSPNDKINDNLFFGCCCGDDSWFANKVCSCQTASSTCNSTCVRTAIREKNRYYYAAKELYHNVTALYPKSHVWLAGHSLGGSTASLVGMTVGTPVVTFEAPGEAMAANRLGLPTPPGHQLGSLEYHPSTAIFHFGHNADPLFMGTCGWPCYAKGFAMESVCHAGKECVYNTTGDLGWGSHLSSHKITTVIHDVLEAYNKTAECKTVVDCVDCYQWKYFENNGSSTTTLSSTTSTPTRTETCKTPGWWGCLDETTTTSIVSSTTVEPSTTSTCETPGYFGGCRDVKTTTAIRDFSFPGLKYAIPASTLSGPTHTP